MDDEHDPLANPGDGVPASYPAALVRPQAVVETVVRWLRQLHASASPGASEVDVEVYDVDAAFAQASARVAAGEVDPAGFDEAYRPQTAQQMLEMADSYRTILAGRDPITPVRVHGALTLDDLLIADGDVVGWKQVPLRIGDPFADYAALARDFVKALGPGSILALFEQLEIADPDPIRLEYWVCIGQLR